MAEPLTGKQRTQLRGMAMKLKPVAQVGKQGITDTVIREVSAALTRFELVKVRIVAETRPERATRMEELATRTQSELCGATGNTASYYRASEKKLIKLS